MSDIAIHSGAPSADDHSTAGQGHGGHANGDHADAAHAHSPYLAHHFDTMAQQYDSGKMGMWVFLGTELLMFGGLFCLYAMYRSNHPDVFLAAHHALNTTLGAINTAVLLASSLTMAWAVRCSQLNQKKALLVLLLVTLLGGFGFMTIKAMEYAHKFEIDLGPGILNKYSPKYEGTDAENNALALRELADKRAAELVRPMSVAVDPERAAGEPTLYFDPHAGTSDAAKIVPHTGGPRGMLANNGVMETAAMDVGGTPVTSIESQHASNVSHNIQEGEAAGHTVNASAGYEQSATASDIPAGGHGEGEELINPQNKLSRQRMNSFFGIYYAMTGLHGVHVLVGMGLIFWIACRSANDKMKHWLPAMAPIGMGLYVGFIYYLSHSPAVLVTAISMVIFGLIWLAWGVVRSQRVPVGTGEFNSEYFAPVDLIGLYWHLVDLIWIFLFPLLYLIHGNVNV